MMSGRWQLLAHRDMPLALKNLVAVGPIADIIGLAAGSTRSLVTRSRHEPVFSSAPTVANSRTATIAQSTFCRLQTRARRPAH
jgi:hypothetical protein